MNELKILQSKDLLAEHFSRQAITIHPGYPSCPSVPRKRTKSSRSLFIRMLEVVGLTCKIHLAPNLITAIHCKRFTCYEFRTRSGKVYASLGNILNIAVPHHQIATLQAFKRFLGIYVHPFSQDRARNNAIHSN